MGQLFSGQGKVYLGNRNAAGSPLDFIFLGNVPRLEFSLNEETIEHRESTSGKRLQDLRLSTAKDGTVTMVFEEIEVENLKLALFGEDITIASSTVTDEALPNPAVAERTYITAHRKISSVVITDSAGSPNTLSSSQYTVNGADGSITLDDITTGGPYTEPFLVDYSYAAATQVKMFTQSIPERWLHFAGLNTADTVTPDNPVTVDFYRVALSPAQVFALINEELAQFELSGAVLADTTKTEASDFGQFGRIVL